MINVLKKKKVNSTLVSEIYYSPRALSMVVKFNNGSYYLYKNVTSNIFNKIVKSESVGKAFCELIRKYPERFPYYNITDTILPISEEGYYSLGDSIVINESK